MKKSNHQKNGQDKKELLLILNHDFFLLSHRKEILIEAIEKDYDVTVVTIDTGKRCVIEDLGAGFIPYPINPTGKNILDELRAFRFLYRLYKRHKKAVVHHIGMKNVLWGGLAARFAEVTGVVNAVAGLGTVFGNSDSLFSKVLMRLVQLGINRGNVKIIFQNRQDMQIFKDKGLLSENNHLYIKGSGVNLEEYPFSPEPDGDKLTILFSGRMLVEKGVLTFVEAAEELRGEYGDKVRFVMCGGLSENPTALKAEEIEQLCDDSYISWLGNRDDIPQILAQCSIYCLPSYYGEGLPKAIIEALAIGRPVVTCDSVGCRDTVDEGVNGFLIPPKDSRALADRLRRLIGDKEMRERMGKASREKAEKEFDVRNVVREHLRIYESLLK